MLALALPLVLAAAAPPPARAPAFELTALGVLGGDTDGNLTSFLLGAPNAAPELLIDGGSVLPGLERHLQKTGALAADASISARTHACMDALKPLRAMLLTHAHLDHWGGFVDASTLFVGLALGGKAPLPIVALPETVEAVRTDLFRSPLWVDFTAIPPKSPALALQPLPPGGKVALGELSVQAVLLSHTVPAAAFVIQRGDAAFVHLGDTGPTQAVWDAARPLLAKHALRAIDVEVSFPDADSRLALASGHLTRNLLLTELGKLAALPDAPPADADDARALAYAQALAPKLAGVSVVAIHIKALGYDRVVAELGILKKAGIDLVIPEQGATYRF